MSQCKQFRTILIRYMAQFVKNLAMMDTLTGLPNRRAIQLIIDQEMSRRKRFKTPVSLMILDVDHFKMNILQKMGAKALTTNL